MGHCLWFKAAEKPQIICLSVSAMCQHVSISQGVWEHWIIWLDLTSNLGIPSYSDLVTTPLLSQGDTDTFPGTIWVLMDIEPSHKDGGLKCAGFKQTNELTRTTLNSEKKK